MRIVVLDGHTLNPGDVSWEPICQAVMEVQQLDRDQIEFVVYDRTEEADTVDRAKLAEVVFTNKTKLGRDVLTQLPQLRYIGVLATGYDVVDTACAHELGITVTNVPSYSTAAVAQYVMALLLSWCHHIELHHNAVQHGSWQRSEHFSFCLTPQTELAGKTFGIIGFGRIGQQVARLASAFDMRVLVASRSTPDTSQFPYIEVVSQDELLKQSDVVSLHCPLTDETRAMVNRGFIAKMKPEALIINTSRGGLVQEDELAEALIEGRIGGALLDVLSEEPPAKSNPLLALLADVPISDAHPLIGANVHRTRPVVITPHMAWASQASRRRLVHIAAGNLQAFLAGTPRHTV